VPVPTSKALQRALERYPGVVAAQGVAKPFFDELVAAQLPELGDVKWTLPYYLKYADALRALAQKLGGGWTPASLECALWAHVGGKAGAGRQA
jgi:hypothetical protein